MKRYYLRQGESAAFWWQVVPGMVEGEGNFPMENIYGRIKVI